MKMNKTAQYKKNMEAFDRKREFNWRFQGSIYVQFKLFEDEYSEMQTCRYF